MSCRTFDEPGFSLEEVRKTARENRLLTMEMEFSQRCNFNCPYCYVTPCKDKDELTRDECKGIIRQARKLGARTIIVLGGEPMIYPDIMEMLGCIREQQMEVDIFTNGSNITPENARQLAELGVKVVLKLNSRKADMQNHMCGREDAYQIICSALENLKAAGYGHDGLQMAISSVICRENLDELPDLWRWIRSQGIEPYFEMITPQGVALENEWLQISAQETEALFNTISKIDRDEFKRDWKPQPPLVGNNCLRHQYSLYVNAYGDVMPCVGIDIVVGNVRDSSLASVIKDSEVLQDLRAFRKHLKGPCANCQEAELCYGCRGAAYQLTGDYLGSDPMCWHNADRRHEIERLPVAVAAYVPHAGQVKIVDMLKQVGEREAVVETFVTDQSAFISDDGALEPSAFVEVIAQSAAAHNGFRTRHLTSKMEGFLIGVKHLRILGEARVGDRLLTTVRKEARLGDFGVIHGTVFRDGECLASGEITIYHNRSGEVE